MIQPIVHDPLFLAQKSARATPADADTARDLLETLTAHADDHDGFGHCASPPSMAPKAQAWAHTPQPAH